MRLHQDDSASGRRKLKFSSTVLTYKKTVIASRSSRTISDQIFLLSSLSLLPLFLLFILTRRSRKESKEKNHHLPYPNEFYCLDLSFFFLLPTHHLFLSFLFHIIMIFSPSLLILYLYVSQSLSFPNR